MKSTQPGEENEIENMKRMQSLIICYSKFINICQKLN